MNTDEWEADRRHFLWLCAGVVLSAAAPEASGKGKVGIAHHFGAPCAPYGYPEAAYYRVLPEDES